MTRVSIQFKKSTNDFAANIFKNVKTQLFLKYQDAYRYRVGTNCCKV